MNSVWESLRQVFAEPNWFAYFAQLIALFLLFYFVFRILKEGEEPHLIAAYILIVLFSGVIFLFSENLDANTFVIFLSLLSLFFLLLFNNELKRLIRKGKMTPQDKETPLSRGASAARAELGEGDEPVFLVSEDRIVYAASPSAAEAISRASRRRMRERCSSTGIGPSSGG